MQTCVVFSKIEFAARKPLNSCNRIDCKSRISLGVPGISFPFVLGPLPWLGVSLVQFRFTPVSIRAFRPIVNA